MLRPFYASPAVVYPTKDQMVSVSPKTVDDAVWFLVSSFCRLYVREGCKWGLGIGIVVGVGIGLGLAVLLLEAGAGACVVLLALSFIDRKSVV